MPPQPSSAARRSVCASPALLAAAVLLLGGCDARPLFVLGDECELNTECGSPLVCRLGRCRVECRAQRDCGPGLECVRDELGLGACQLPAETECMLTSDCPTHLVCHFQRCTNECGDDRDCPPGSVCTMDESGSRGCRDESTTQCQHNSECDALMPGHVCAVDGRCRPPCIEDWDCSDGRTCVRPAGAVSYCAFVEGDAGTPMIDAGMDASTDAGIESDAGSDSGTDAGMTASDAATGVSPPAPPRMAAGQYSTCAAPMGEALHCWGDNTNGRLGDGTVMPRTTPVMVDGSVADETMIGVGQGHACAVSAGALRCWGKNDYGQLGTGSVGPDQLSPVDVTGLPAGVIEDLSLGAEHTCAIVDAALYCWGRNGAGQLGLGDMMDRSSPVRVTLSGGVPVEVETFSQHTCVRVTAGAVQCFGQNMDGQLGNGGTAMATSPTPVSGITDAVDLAVGSTHTCALHATGTVSCWGAGIFGQLGDGSGLGGPRSTVPTATDPIAADVLQIDAGSAHTCARTASALYCWGENGDGQCGQNRFTMSTVASPTPVSGLPLLAEVRAGSNHTCVHVGTRDLRCFGQNTRGQLGDGTMTTSSMPVPVAWP